jgi:hypothetical protein
MLLIRSQGIKDVYIINSPIWGRILTGKILLCIISGLRGGIIMFWKKI